jgi:uncharacterized membrane protein
VTSDNYKILVQKHYENLVKYNNEDKANETKSTSSFPLSLITSFSAKYQLPALIALAYFVILMLIRPLIVILSVWTTWILWQLIKVTGFAQIKIETVEAEVVSL